MLTRNREKKMIFFFFIRGPVVVAFGLSGKRPPWPSSPSETGVFFYVRG